MEAALHGSLPARARTSLTFSHPSKLHFLSLFSLTHLFSPQFYLGPSKNAQTPPLPHGVFLSIEPELPGILDHPALRQWKRDQSEGNASLTPRIAAQLTAPPSRPRRHLVLRSNTAGWSDSLRKQSPSEKPWWGGVSWRGRAAAATTSCLGHWKTKSQRCRVSGAAGAPLLLCHRQPMRGGCPSPFGNDSFPLLFRCRPGFKIQLHQTPG